MPIEINRLGFSSFFRCKQLCLKFCVFLCIAFCLPVLAQTNTGSVVGTVRDPSGAVVAGALVDVTNDATNVSMKFATNADGGYQALQLIPGVYSIKATHQGYSSEVRPNITIDVQTRAQVDFALAIGSVQQQVSVSATSQLLQTQSADVGGG